MPLPSLDADVEIVEGGTELLSFFRSINEEWIGDMFVLEEADLDVLRNAEALILERGGRILYARHDTLGIVGTCALLDRGARRFELTKMGVAGASRGRKIGERLLRRAIALAREIGADDLFLLTNRRCEAAIHLYEKLGFAHDAEIMREFGATYHRCDVAMRLREL